MFLCDLCNDVLEEQEELTLYSMLNEAGQFLRY